MNGIPGEPVTLAELVRSEEQGLNLNRLLFAKYLVMTRRISEEYPAPPRAGPVTATIQPN